MGCQEKVPVCCPCSWLTALHGHTVVEQATSPTVQVSCSSCEIPGRSGFAFHSSHYSKALRGLVAVR